MRRRKRFTWLPVNGSAPVAEASPNDLTSDLYDVLIVNGDFTQRTVVYPLTCDHILQPAELTTLDTIGEVAGTAWFLERLVGRIDGAYSTAIATIGTNTYIPNARVGLGFFVARADMVDDNFPLGYAQTDVNQAFNPLNPSTQREPWLWHRTWVLGIRNNVGSALNAANLAYSVANVDYPIAGAIGSFGSSTANGTIDAHSNRLIASDCRLYAAVGVQGQTFQPEAAVTATNFGSFFFALQYRILGQLRRPTSTGTF